MTRLAVTRMPIKRTASAILQAFEKAQAELVGKAVVLTDGSQCAPFNVHEVAQVVGVP